MNNNTFLYRIGLNPENFINNYIDPITIDGGLLYLVEERKGIRICPYCNNKITEYKSKEYNFMKHNWRLFLLRKDEIPNKTYYHQASGVETSYEDLIFHSVLRNEHFSKAYNILQDLYKYSDKVSYSEAMNFIQFIYERLKFPTLDELVKVGNTFYKWRHEIANSFARNAIGYNISNGIAENMNNHIATIIKISYGYSNYERFRKRVLLICKYNKNWI